MNISDPSVIVTDPRRLRVDRENRNSQKSFSLVFLVASLIPLSNYEFSSQFIDDFNKLIQPAGIEVELVLAFAPAVSSIESEFFQHIKSITASMYPGSRVAPAVSTGFTDSHFTRELGIDSYGFNPIIFNPDDF